MAERTWRLKMRIFLVLNVIMFLYILFGLHIEVNNGWVNSIFGNNSMYLNSSKNDTSNLLEPENTRPNYYWILNNNILQYSAYLIKKSDDTFSMEVFIFDLKELNRHFNCAIRYIQRNKILTTSAHKIIWISDQLKKVYCEFKNLTFDSKLYGIVLNAERSENETIIFHELVIIDSTKPKIKSIGHCVHTLYSLIDINSNKTKQLEYWFHIQKNIGISEIRLYIYQANETVIDYLRNKYKDFAIFVDFVGFDKFCGIYHENTTIFQNCKIVYNKILLHGGYMERVNTNDCFLNLKYKYEMVTNYDFDEIIFPRSNNLNKYQSFNCESKYCQYFNQTYNLYDYAIKMFNLMNPQIVGCLMFINVAFIRTDIYLDNFMKELVNLTAPTNVFYRDEEGKVLKVSVKTQDDAKKMNYYSSLYQSLRCLSKNKSIKLLEFDRFFAFSAASNFGKSILKTNLVETVNQHSSDEMVLGAEKRELPLEYGYSSHLRHNYKAFYLDNARDVDNIFIDIDYYLFVLKNFEILNC
jgi:hypothetical protein